MALYHFSVSQIKRSAGQSVLAAAAYRAGERLYSEYYDEISDYTREPSFTSYADPSLTACGMACDSAKPPKTQSVQGLNSCYFIEDVTKKVPKSQNFGTLT